MTKAAVIGTSRGRTGWQRWWGAALVLGLALAGCPQQPAPRPAPSPPGDGTVTPSLPSLPAVGKALVIEQASSPVLDELKKRVTLVPYTGKEKVAEHDLLIFDGDSQTPQAIEGNKLVEEAFRTGRWVLGVDLTAEHKRTGLGRHLHLATEKPALGLMFRKEPTGDGRSVYRILEAKPVEAAATGRGAVRGALEGTAKAISTPNAQAAAFADTAVTTLQGASRATPQQVGGGAVCQDVNVPSAAARRVGAQDVPQPINPFPASLVYAQWCYTDLSLQQYRLPASSLNKNFTQVASAIFNTTFTLALNNSQNPLGDYQFLMVQNDTSSTPATNGFANQSNKEQAWFQDKITHAVSPFNTTLPFTWVANGPSADNLTENYTANSGFTVGFQGDSPNASYTWSNSTSYSIPDWKVSSSLNGNAVSWNYRSNNPDADDSHTGSSWFYSFDPLHVDRYGTPIPPNQLSLTQNQFHSAITYRTSQVDTSWENFTINQSVDFWDTWCTPVDALGCTADGGSWGATPSNPTAGDLFKVNMAAVVPDPVQSITFSPNPAAPGATVTGTVTLQRPAPIDTRVALSTTSANGNANLQQSMVTVPQGQTSATFTILTNGNGLDSNPGSQVVVPITAFNVQGYTAQLTIQNPKVQSLTFNPAVVTAGTAATGTLTLSDPVLSDTTVSLSSGSAFATPSASSVTIPKGQTSATFTVQTSGSGLPPGTTSPATITAGLGTQSFPVQLTVTNPTVASIAFSPNPVVGANAAAGTLTLTAAAAVDTVLPLASGSSNATVPASVTVPKGQTSATFQVQTNLGGMVAGELRPVAVSSVYAQTAQGTLTVRNPKVASVATSPSSLTAGQGTTGTVTMDVAVGADIAVSLVSSSPNATIPASVTVAKGQTSVTFQVGTNPAGLAAGATAAATMTAGYAGATAQSSPLTVVNPKITALTYSPTTVAGGQTVTATVTMDRPVGITTTIALNGQAASDSTVPASVTVPAGQASASFAIQTTNQYITPGNSSVQQVSASYAGQSYGTTFTVTVPGVSFQSFTFDNPQPTAGQKVTGTITLSAPAPKDLNLIIQSSSSNVTLDTDNLAPLIPKGGTVGIVELDTNGSGISNGGSVDVTITAGSYQLPNQSVQGKLTVSVPSVATIQSITFSPNPATAGQTVTATVTLNAPAPPPAVPNDDDPYVNVVSPNYNAAAGNFNIVQGQTIQTFLIYTNTSRINPGSYPITVTVQYPFPQTFQAQFNLVIPASTGVRPREVSAKPSGLSSLESSLVGSMVRAARTAGR